MDTDILSSKSVTKAPTNDTNYTSPASHYKCALLKSIITPTKIKEYQIVGVTTLRAMIEQYDQLCQGWKYTTIIIEATK